MKYRAYRILDGKPKWIVVGENGNIVNRNPSKDELKGLKTEIVIVNHGWKGYTNKELLNFISKYVKEYGKQPSWEDFDDNNEYPSPKTYQKHFGSWSNALKLVELDVESIVKKGILIDNTQKGRFAEILVRDHFKKHPIDLAGENSVSHCDGICPNGKTYDVKGSKLHIGGYYHFGISNKYKEDIELFYLLGFNEDYTKFKYTWRIPGEIIEKNDLHIHLNRGSYAKFTIYNMKEYDITNKMMEILREKGYDYI